MKQENVGKSVVIDGDTLKIVEWTQFTDMYVLENGIVVKYREK